MLVMSCEYNSIEEIEDKKNFTCDTDNMSYTEDIKPILESNCVSCHNLRLASGNVRLDNYQVVASEAETIVLAVKQEGGAVSMPPTGKLPACDILKIEAWFNQGAIE